MKQTCTLVCASVLLAQVVIAHDVCPAKVYAINSDTNFLPLTAGSGSPLTGTLNGTAAYFSGNVGIGTSTPSEKLHVVGSLQVGAIGDFIWDNTYSQLRVGFSAPQSVDGLTARLAINGSVKLGAYNYPSEMDIGGYGDFRVIGLSEVARFTNIGLGIGTSVPTEKLCVEGNIRAKKIIVTQTGWSDYVFKNDYRLRSLPSLEKFISTHQHLPDIPSAGEVANNGISVGENQALLLKKIEELTLYVIQLSKENKQMANEIKKLKDKIEKK